MFTCVGVKGQRYTNIKTVTNVMNAIYFVCLKNKRYYMSDVQDYQSYLEIQSSIVVKQYFLISLLKKISHTMKY